MPYLYRIFSCKSRSIPPSKGTVRAAVGVLSVGLALVMMNSAFSSDRAEDVVAASEVVPKSQAAEGARIIASKPCGGCHTIPGIPGANATIGPNLAGVASRTKIAGGAVDNHGPNDLKAWIMNPGGLKPGTIMPNLGLSDDEATKIVAFLVTLK
jgi:cytochrome c